MTSLDLFSLIAQVWAKLVEHMLLSGGALLIAISIALPVSIALNHWQRLRVPILGITHVFQTIPSLALLALLVPLIGIGTRPALIVLVLYSLLPLIKNIYTGLQEVPQQNIETAHSLGFTSWQRLYLVKLPLALPMIMAGIRTAASMVIGIATIAAFIGAGGLGDLITQGLSLNSPYLILLGAIPTALLALIVDYGLGQLEMLMRPQGNKRSQWIALGSGCLILLLLLAPGIIEQTKNKASQTITIASKNFTEQYILTEIMAQSIEAHTDLKVVRKPNLGTTAMIHAALLKGDVDLYPEYTGTAALTVLEHTKIQPNHDLWQTVHDDYKKKYELVWLPPFGFSNDQSLAIPLELARKHQIQNIGDLNKHPDFVLAATAEFLHRADSLPKLQKEYGLRFKSIKQMTPDLAYQAIANQNVQVICAFTTDAKLTKYHLMPLKDNLHCYPSYHAAPVIRKATLQAHPEIKKALIMLDNKIDTATMRKLNAEVDIKKRSPAEVAREFLIRNQYNQQQRIGLRNPK
ncbi:MAG: glycine betaine ABC transporter substrate-binding protein [Pseudomonadota bacterium]